MPKVAKELSAIEVKRLVKPGLHAIGGVSGLHLQISKAGARSWILRTKVGDKRRDIGLGGFPDVTLATARAKAREAKQKIVSGSDPIADRKSANDDLKAAQAKRISFSEAANRCHAAKASEFRNAKHKRDWISSLERHAFPTIGSISVALIDISHVLSVLQPIWEEKTETATRVRQRIESVLTWATVSGFRSGQNPAQWDANLKEVLPSPRKITKVKHQRTIPWDTVPAFWKELCQREGIGAKALQFAILTAGRSGEVRFARWSEIDLAQSKWTIPAERMKANKPHIVPLSIAAINLLKELPFEHDSQYLFQAPRGGSLSDTALSSVTKRMNVDAVPHGFRSSFKDWARNRTSFPDEVSELALAHVNNDATRSAYARDGLYSKRVALMQDWSDFLFELS